MWFSNRRAKWRREEKLRNQRRTPNSNISNISSSSISNNIVNCSGPENVTPAPVTGFTAVAESGSNSNDHHTSNTSNGNNDQLQGCFLGSSNYIHISSLSPPRLNLNNSFGSAMSSMYPSIHPSIPMSDSYG